MTEFCPTLDFEKGWCHQPPKRRWTSKHSIARPVDRWLASRRVVAEITLVGARFLQPERSLEQRFREQADKWARETAHLSSPTQMMSHPSYHAILGMGREYKEDVIRLLLRDLKDNRREWFGALSYLAHDNPIKPQDAGKMNKMIKAWVDWGTAKGFL